MRKLIGLAVCVVLLPFCDGTASAATFTAINVVEQPWAKLLGSVGILASATQDKDTPIVVAGPAAPAEVAAQAEDHLLILEGTGAAAEKIGIALKAETMAVRQICDRHAPNMQIIWEQAVETPIVTLPADFQVFAKERWKGAPVLAGKRTAHGAVLWMASSPGDSGFERYPYMIHALVDLGLKLPAQSTELWAFFDSSYRIRADVDYLARKWRQAGFSVLHVAAWHNVEADPIQDAYLKALIEACHRNAILVYAWLELPHVSEKFWAEHPEWREKTAAGQDAQLDWRKLMNLQNKDCRAAVAAQVSGLLGRFDWDGVNVAELYFESLEGASNPARFTPMNDDVRADFKSVAGFDPKLLFDPQSSYEAGKNPAALRKFLDYRAGLVSRMQTEWLDVIDRSRAKKPYLDVVLTHIDDRFDPGIRDELGADIQKSLPAIQARKATLLVEDPATMWSLGPERYAKLAEKYRELTPGHERLAVDINVVERYQDVYPTKKQTGVELFELVHQAASSFGRVTLYFENSLEKQDLALLPVAAAAASVNRKANGEMDIEATEQTRLSWDGPVLVDGKLWPVQNGRGVLVPAGKHRVTAGTAEAAVEITDFNGELHNAASFSDRTDLSYTSRSRALAMIGSKISRVEVDGAEFWKAKAGETITSVPLPAGQHLVTFYR